MKLAEWKIYFEPRDLWVGVYWNRSWESVSQHDGVRVHKPVLKAYVCVLPCLCLRLTFRGKEPAYGH